MKNTPKFIICGHGRHGKDTVAEYLRDKYNLKFTSSSLACLDLFIYDKLKNKYKYNSKEECFEDRANHRKEWFDLITEYCSKHPAKLTEYIFETNDIYVGMRNKNELLASKRLADLVIWVDRSKHLPSESSDSNQISEDMCQLVIDNNGDLDCLYENIDVMLEKWI